MADGMLSLSWNNHSTTFSHTLTTFRAKERYTDATLACEGRFYQVHRLVLSTCSEYFEKMFEKTPCKHPVIVLSEIHREELEALLSYMYAGYVNVAENKLTRLIKVAELLEIKGLAVPDEPPNSNKKSSSTQPAGGGRTSPVIHTRQSHSPVNDKSFSSPKSTNSSIDRLSPSPKRVRKDSDIGPHENTALSIPTPAPVSTRAVEANTQHSDVSSWSEHDDRRDRSNPSTHTDYPSTPQEPLTPKVQVTLDETLVKEEEVEDRGEKTGDAVVDETDDNNAGGSTLLIPKYDPMPQDPEVLTQPPTLHEAVMEALAGPSGMQAWAGGGTDISRRLTMPDNFLSEGSQDVSTGALNQTTPQPHPTVGVGRGGHRHSGRDGPKKRHQCPYCAYSTARKDHLKKHIRTHTGRSPSPVASVPTAPHRNII